MTTVTIVFAEDGGEQVEALLARIIDQLADAERARLSAQIPGFAEAIAWLEAGEWRVRSAAKADDRPSQPETA